MELSCSARYRPFNAQIFLRTKSQFFPQNPRNSLQFRSPVPFMGLTSRVPSVPSNRPSRVPVVRASGGGDSISGRIKGRILTGSVITVILAVANRVLYKLALVPMKDFPFFLAQVTTFG